MSAGICRGKRAFIFAFRVPAKRQQSRFLSVTPQRQSQVQVQDGTENEVEISISHHAKSIVLNSPAHSLHNASFPFLFLRDADRSEHSFHPLTKQKTFQTTTISPELNLSQAKVVHGALRLRWEGESVESELPLDFLRDYATREGWDKLHYFDQLEPITWDNSKFIGEGKHKAISYDSYKSDPLPFLQQLTKYGLVFLTGVPTEEKEGVHTELRNVVETIGELRRTWYGDLWDVRDEKKDTKNVANTNLDLGLHMDLVHFQNPPRYQFLHCLKNRGIKGGRSYFVDSFKAAERMWADEKWRRRFDVLSRTKMGFEYRNNGHHTRWEHPVFELDPNTPPVTQGGDPIPPKLFAVNYAPPFQSPLLLRHHTPSQLASLHRSLTTFTNLVEEEGMRYEVQLEEGDLVAFDNRRVLHARTAFDFDGESGDEKGRWLKGAYMEGDAVWDRTRVLLAQAEGNKGE
ncbi:Clavaminate synthase-like protein [Atractiella rhizophila]|nr:Clavaminate synthase-like protein [Atractiella rhizophila]